LGFFPGRTYEKCHSKVLQKRLLKVTCKFLDFFYKKDTKNKNGYEKSWKIPATGFAQLLAVAIRVVPEKKQHLFHWELAVYTPTGKRIS